MFHYDNMPMHYTENFNGCKNDKVSVEFLYVFLPFAQNIDCGYR